MGWLIAYEDDASRFIVGYGLFPEATSEHSLEVLKQAIGEHGKPRRSSRTGEYSSILSRQTTD